MGNTELEEDSPVKTLMPAVYEKLATMEREQLITQFVAAEFNRFMEYYKDAPDLNVYKEAKSSRRNSNVAFSRLFVNLGKTDKISSGDIIGLINSKMKGVNC